MTIQRETLQPFETKKGGWLQKQKEDAKPYNREGDSSPIFPFVNTELTTGTELLIDLYEDTPATRKYGIFKNLRITNTSAQNLVLYPNQNRNRGIFIANNSTVALDSGALGGGYTSFIIYNAGAGTIASSEIRMECFKEGATIDSTMKTASKMLHDAFRMVRGF